MADISKITIESGTYDIKDSTARSDISTINTNIGNIENSLKTLTNIKNKKTIIIGDSLCLTDRWGDWFIAYSGCDGENYGNGSAGFLSQGITSPFVNMTFQDMLEYIIAQKTSSQLQDIEYLIVGGGINDALNSYTPSDITTAVNNFITLAKTSLPNAKIIIFPLHTFKWLTPIQHQRYMSILHACENNGVMTTSNFLWWTITDRTIDSGDHIHLTTDGYKKLAYNILSFVHGSNRTDVEEIDFAMGSEFTNVSLGVTRIGNIVYARGLVRHKDTSVSNGQEIVAFSKGTLITGTYADNVFTTALYYGSSPAISTINIYNGNLLTGIPLNYNSIGSQPYIYINISWRIGINGGLTS